MARPKVSKRARDEDDEVASDEEVTKPTKKTTKKAKTVAASAAIGKAVEDEDGNTYWPISNTRRVNVTAFKGKVLVNIREYYTDAAGDLKPGKKGISLPLDQFNALVETIPSICTDLREQGHETVDFSSIESAAARPSSSSSNDGKKGKAKAKAKPKKSNIEATSDEDEE